MGRKNTTLRHLVDRRPNEVRQIPGPPEPPPPNRESSYRLSYGANGSEKRQISYSGLANSIRLSALPSTTFFLDTCFINAHQVPNDVWNSLDSHHTILSPGVLLELREWLDGPFRNGCFHERVRATMAGKPSSVQLLDTSHYSSVVQSAAKYYVRLLCVRKALGAIEKQRFTAEHGREPSDDELANRCRRIVGDRGWPLAEKGMSEGTRINFGTDEELVVWAVLFAVLTGHETVILTRDRDVLEQFYKMVYLLDTHYRSCLIARELERNPQGFDDVQIHASDDARFLWEIVEEKDARLLEMPYRFDQIVLPTHFRPVSVQCWLLGGDPCRMSFARLPFLAEREMECVIYAKGATNGLNTALLNGLNCHRCFAPYIHSIPAAWFLVGRDHRMKLFGLEFPIVDVELCIRANEGTERVVYRNSLLAIPNN